MTIRRIEAGPRMSQAVVHGNTVYLAGQVGTPGKSVAEQTFTGPQPPPFAENGGNYFYGLTPMEDFMEWLESVLE